MTDNNHTRLFWAIIVATCTAIVATPSAHARGGGGHSSSGGSHASHSAPLHMVGSHRPQISTRQLSYQAPGLSKRTHLPHTSMHGGTATFAKPQAAHGAPSSVSVKYTTTTSAKGVVTYKRTVTETGAAPFTSPQQDANERARVDQMNYARY